MKIRSASLVLGLGFAVTAFPLKAQTTNVLNSTGNAGIGTTSPNEKLEIYGGSSAATIRLSNTATSNDFIRAATSGNLELGTYYGHSVGILTSNAERVRIDGNGNVGIGTASPSNKLHIQGSAGSAGILLTNSDAGGASWNINADSNYGYGLNFAQIGVADGRLFIAKTSGNVGISTINPLSKLHVMGVGRFGLNDAGTNNIGGLLIASGTGSGGARQYWIGASDPTAHNNNMFQISDYNGTTNSPLLTIFGTHAGSAAGNVGIGTTSPDWRLTLNASDNTALSITRGGSPRALLGDTGSNDGGDLLLYSASGGLSTMIRGSAASYFNGGNVGINTTNPTYPLSVNGTIRAKEVIVETGWSDYVFADDYRLAPLSEVESHIKTEKHLPGIPSAAEVATHGVSMGAMQSKLLAKIEELTLHQIAQEKRLNAQSTLLSEQAARLHRLEQENVALRTR